MLQLQTRWRPTSRLESSVRPRAEHVTAASRSRPAVRLRTWGSRALPPHPVAAHALRTSPPWQLCVPGLARAVLPLPSCLPVSFTDPPSLHAPVACKSLRCPCDPRGGPPPPRPGRCPRPHGRRPHWAHAVPSSGMPLLTPNSCPPHPALLPPSGPSHRPRRLFSSTRRENGAIFLSLCCCPCPWPQPEWAFNGLPGKDSIVVCRACHRRWPVFSLEVTLQFCLCGFQLVSTRMSTAVTTMPNGWTVPWDLIRHDLDFGFK